MPIYEVVTPTYPVIEPVTDEGQGPQYDVADCVYVEAKNARAAKVEAVRKMRSRPNEFGWLHDCEGNPFTGLKATRIPDKLAGEFADELFGVVGVDRQVIP